MKKFVKFLCGAASMAAVAFGAYCVYKNVIAKKDDEEGKKEKERYIKTGEKADNAGISYLENSARRQREEEAARQAQLAREANARREHEDRLRAKSGRSDVHLNSDGSMVRVGNGDYIPVHEYERQLNNR